MALTAREWLLLPKDEMEARKDELSPEECYKLRTELDMVHFTEEQKMSISEELRYNFIHPKERSSEEQEKFSKMAADIFQKMIREVNEG